MKTQMVGQLADLLRTKVFVRFDEHAVAVQVPGVSAGRMNRITVVHASQTPRRGPASTHTVLAIEVTFPRPWTKKLDVASAPLIRYVPDLGSEVYQEELRSIVTKLTDESGPEIMWYPGTWGGLHGCYGLIDGLNAHPTLATIFDLARVWEMVWARTRGIHPLEAEADTLLARLNAMISSSTRTS